MPSASQILSSVIMTAVGVAIIFRVDMLRGVVTGIQATELGKAAPAGARALYM